MYMMTRQVEHIKPEGQVYDGQSVAHINPNFHVYDATSSGTYQP